MSVSPAPAIERSARRRIAIRLLPFLWWLYVIAFLDRVNVAYAALEMSHNLGFSDRVFGLGAGIFFIGYLLLEIPGALIVERWSARLWIARIMITWGIITVLVGFVHTPRQFYTVRFFLGAAEAGFFPGVIVYLTHWFSRRDLAKAIGSFMVAQPLANFVGSPFAGRILQIHWYRPSGLALAVYSGGNPRRNIWNRYLLLSDGPAERGQVVTRKGTRVDHAGIELGAREKKGGAVVYHRAGASRARCAVADDDLFSGEHRFLWIHDLVPHDFETGVGIDDWHGHAACGNSLFCGSDRNVAE